MKIKTLDRLRYKSQPYIFSLNRKLQNVLYIFFNLIAGVSSIAGLYYAIKGYKDNLHGYDNLLMIIIASLLCFILYFIMKTNSLLIENARYQAIDIEMNKLELAIEIKDDVLERTAECLHNILHETRSRLQIIQNDIDHCAYHKNTVYKRNVSLKRYLLVILSNIKEIFDTMTLDNCSVCMKIIEANDSKDSSIVVSTFLRDNVSFRKRVKYDRIVGKFDINRNSAFNTIINSTENYYISNDLKSEKYYENANSSWSDLYNACAVVPIRCPLFDDGIFANEYDYIGFITVDNKNGGFHEELSYNILGGIADNIYHIFALSEQYFSNAENEPISS